MNKQELGFILQYNRYLQGGTKEASVKVREFIKNVEISENEIHSNNSCVSASEFVEAVKTLMASAFRSEDQIPETWHCDNDCRRVSDIFCIGECNINKGSPKLCPYFVDESLI